MPATKRNKKHEAQLAKKISKHFIEFTNTLGVKCKADAGGDTITLVEIGDEIKIGNIVINLPEQKVGFCSRKFDLHDPNCFEKVEAIVRDCVVSPCGKECKHHANT